MTIKGIFFLPPEIGQEKKSCPLITFFVSFYFGNISHRKLMHSKFLLLLFPQILLLAGLILSSEVTCSCYLRIYDLYPVLKIVIRIRFLDYCCTLLLFSIFKQRYQNSSFLGKLLLVWVVVLFLPINYCLNSCTEKRLTSNS